MSTNPQSQVKNEIPIRKFISDLIQATQIFPTEPIIFLTEKWIQHKGNLSVLLNEIIESPEKIPLSLASVDESFDYQGFYLKKKKKTLRK